MIPGDTADRSQTNPCCCDSPESTISPAKQNTTSVDPDQYSFTADKMGNSMSWISGLLWAKKEIRILILGLVWIHGFS